MNEITRRTSKWGPSGADARIPPVGRRGLSQPPPGAAGSAGSRCPDAELQRYSLRARARHAAATPALPESARELAPQARHRPARHMARSLDDTDRYRWSTRADRPGVGITRFAVVARRPEALPASARRAARHAAGGPRDRLARPLRPSRLSDDPRAGEERSALRDLARRRSSPRELGHLVPAHHGARLVGSVRPGDSRRARDGGAFTALLGPHVQDPQRDAVVLVRRAFRFALRFLQRRHRSHDRVPGHSPATWAVRPRDAR